MIDTSWLHAARIAGRWRSGRPRPARRRVFPPFHCRPVPAETDTATARLTDPVTNPDHFPGLSHGPAHPQGAADGPDQERRVDLERASDGGRAEVTAHDAGMSTVEYAVGTVVAAAFAAVLYKIVTGDSVVTGLTSLIDTALSSTF